MMNKSDLSILIVEDEPLAAVQLASMISKLLPHAVIETVCDTIESAVEWINEHPTPDLSFFDIHLGDGSSFEIFDRCPQFNCSVVFTTAYDQYALNAFKVNSIDYLLKPLNIQDLERALIKFQNNATPTNTPTDQSLIRDIRLAIERPQFKEKLLLKIGTRLVQLNVQDIAYFYSFEKAVYARGTNGKNYLMDCSLEQVELQINPDNFFRISRKYLVAMEAIGEMNFYSSTKLKVALSPDVDNDVFVARERLKPFKAWLEGDKVSGDFTV